MNAHVDEWSLGDERRTRRDTRSRTRDTSWRLLESARAWASERARLTNDTVVLNGAQTPRDASKPLVKDATRIRAVKTHTRPVSNRAYR